MNFPGIYIYLHFYVILDTLVFLASNLFRDFKKWSGYSPIIIVGGCERGVMRPSLSSINIFIVLLSLQFILCSIVPRSRRRFHDYSADHRNKWLLMAKVFEFWQKHLLFIAPPIWECPDDTALGSIYHQIASCNPRPSFHLQRQ